jgi:hypothetical protein
MNPERFGDTAAAAWLTEVLHSAVREVSGGKNAVDMKLLISMCKAEPKSAQLAMQLLAMTLKEELGGSSIEEARGLAKDWRLVLGSIFTAYCFAVGSNEKIPPELKFIVCQHPIIVACGQFVVKDWVASQENRSSQKGDQ